MCEVRVAVVTPNGNGVQRPHPGERPGVVRCNDGLGVTESWWKSIPQCLPKVSPAAHSRSRAAMPASSDAGRRSCAQAPKTVAARKVVTAAALERRDGEECRADNVTRTTARAS